MSKQIPDSCNASADSCPSVYFDAKDFDINYPRNNVDSYFDKVIQKVESVLVPKPPGGGAITHTDTELAAFSKIAPNPVYTWNDDAALCTVTTYEANPTDPYSPTVEKGNVPTIRDLCCNAAIEKGDQTMMSEACAASKTKYIWDVWFNQCSSTESYSNPVTGKAHENSSQIVE